jgi:hypothetical protein
MQAAQASGLWILTNTLAYFLLTYLLEFKFCITGPVTEEGYAIFGMNYDSIVPQGFFLLNFFPLLMLRKNKLECFNSIQFIFDP